MGWNIVWDGRLVYMSASTPLHGWLAPGGWHTNIGREIPKTLFSEHQEPV